MYGTTEETHFTQNSLDKIGQRNKPCAQNQALGTTIRAEVRLRAVDYFYLRPARRKDLVPEGTEARAVISSFECPIPITIDRQKPAPIFIGRGYKKKAIVDSWYSSRTKNYPYLPSTPDLFHFSWE